MKPCPIVRLQSRNFKLRGRKRLQDNKLRPQDNKWRPQDNKWRPQDVCGGAVKYISFSETCTCQVAPPGLHTRMMCLMAFLKLAAATKLYDL